MSKFYLGIDVSKAKLDCALCLPNGKFRTKVVANSPEGLAVLAAWLITHNATEPHACMEATGIYWEAVAQSLSAGGLAVSVVNPAFMPSGANQGLRRLAPCPDQDGQSRCQAHRQLLPAGHKCAERNPVAWQAPSEAELTLRALVLRLDALQATCALRVCGHRKATASGCPVTLCAATSKATCIGWTAK